MINVLAVCPCIFQRSRPTLNWLSLIHLAFAKELLILRMLCPCFTCCAATSVFTSVCFWLFYSICRNDAQTINVRTWPQVSIHSRVQELCGWYKTFIFSYQCQTGGQCLLCANDFYRLWSLSVCVCAYSYSPTEWWLMPFCPFTFLISCWWW